MPKVLDSTDLSPDAAVRLHSHRSLLWVSLWLTLLLLAVKILSGLAMGSLSLMAQALQTLVCGFSLVLAAIVQHRAQDLEDRSLGGHGRLEASLAFLVVAFLGFVCLTLLGMALYELDAQAHHHSPALLLNLQGGPVLLLCGLWAMGLGLACLEQAQSKRLHVKELGAIARYRFQDSAMQAVILFTLVLAGQGYAWLDPLMALVSLAVAVGSCTLVLRRQLPLMLQQMAVAPEALAATIHQVEGITRCVSIRSQGLVGRSLIVEVQLILHPEFLSIAPELFTRVEAAIRERYGPATVKVRLHPKSQLS
jgi:divalent metal cation (Fe/Co/Zn/Cd) transporter